MAVLLHDNLTHGKWNFLFVLSCFCVIKIGLHNFDFRYYVPLLLLLHIYTIPRIYAFSIAMDGRTLGQHKIKEIFISLAPLVLHKESDKYLLKSVNFTVFCLHQNSFQK